jgi:S-adenosylmethionine-diacylglycerol 3-amino-3-carboxypropyl transferase
MNLATIAVAPPWIDEALRRPIAFAQVREDPRIDRWVVDLVGSNARMIMVASGGCTAAALAATANLSHLHLVDANPAQIALTRLKLRLLATCDARRRMALLGHALLDARERARRLTSELDAMNLPHHVLGPMELVADVGPDHAGRYEALFAELRRALIPAADEIAMLLNLRDPVRQAQLIAPSTGLGRALDAAFEWIMSQEILVSLFGAEATQNRMEPYSRYFAKRTREVLSRLPAATNPYLWQVLRGRFPDLAVSPWLESPIPSALPSLTWSTALMADVLGSTPREFDVVHLSNILDWLSPENARRTLDLAWAALRPGGWVVIRQLNSELDIPALGQPFVWDSPNAARLHACDRSYFYRALHLGMKR